MGNILITGVAGFIGSHTADEFLKAGHRVWGVDSLRTGRLSNICGAIRQGLRFHELDVLDSSRLARIVEESRIDAVVHLAALVSVSESIASPDENFRLNVEATHRVAEISRQCGVKRIVFASSAAVYGDNAHIPLKETEPTCPISPYGGAKLASEQLLLTYAQTYSLCVRVQRYFNVYGTRQDPRSPYSGVISVFVRNVIGEKSITIFGDGRQTRDFVHVRDVARANLLAATSTRLTSGIANICTGRASSLLRVVRTLGKITPVKSIEFQAPRAGDIRHSTGNPKLAAHELKFVANVPLSRGLAELLRRPGR